MERLNKKLHNIGPPIISILGQIDDLKSQWISGAQMSPQALGRLKKSVLVTSTGASTRIEGAKLSDEDVEKLMRGIEITKFLDRDKQEVKGYYELLQNVFDTWGSIRFSESTIKHFHKELLKYVEKDERHRGNYKTTENTVEMRDAAGNTVAVLFQPTPAYLTPKEMQELTDWAREAFDQKKYHPLVIIGNFILEFLSIHPFQDGNGRLSRILTNLLLLKEGYRYVPYISHEKLIEDNKTEYYLALRKTQTTLKTKAEDITPWLSFFLDIVLKQSKLALELLSSENIEKLLSATQLSVWNYIRNVGEATPMEISEKAAVARATVNQALDKLLKLKKIERLGQGRGTRYKKL